LGHFFAKKSQQKNGFFGVFLLANMVSKAYTACVIAFRAMLKYFGVIVGLREELIEMMVVVTKS